MYSLAIHEERQHFVRNTYGRQSEIRRLPHSDEPRSSSDVVESTTRQQDNKPDAVLHILDRIGCGYVVVDNQRMVVNWNRSAELILECLDEGLDMSRQLSLALRKLLPGISSQFPLGTLSWVVIPCPGDKPVVMLDQNQKTSGHTSIIVLLDRDAKSGPNPDTLQQMFGLTNAETLLAMRLAQGDAPLDVARSRRLSRTTIRSQLASLFQKTETKRQAELVALLGRISVLP